MGLGKVYILLSFFFLKKVTYVLPTSSLLELLIAAKNEKLPQYNLTQKTTIQFNGCGTAPGNLVFPPFSPYEKIRAEIIKKQSEMFYHNKKIKHKTSKPKQDKDVQKHATRRSVRLQRM